MHLEIVSFEKLGIPFTRFSSSWCGGLSCLHLAFFSQAIEPSSTSIIKAPRSATGAATPSDHIAHLSYVSYAVDSARKSLARLRKLGDSGLSRSLDHERE